MTSSRPRILARGIAALAFALIFATFTIATPFFGQGRNIIAPAVACGVAAVALAGLAMSAFALYDGASRNARTPFRVAHVGVFAIPVAGLVTGAVVAAVDGDAAIFGVAAWSTAIAWLVHLFLIRGQARDLRSAAQ
jgi:hypothetical protein